MNIINKYQESLNDRITQKEIKDITHYLIYSLQNNQISEKSFYKIISLLLGSYLENKFNQKLLQKTKQYERKLTLLLEG